LTGSTIRLNAVEDLILLKRKFFRDQHSTVSGFFQKQKAGEFKKLLVSKFNPANKFAD